MANTLWRCLLRSIAAVLFTIVWAGGADAVVSISACGTLSVRETYNLTADLHAMGGDCLVVANNGIVINLQGHSVIQDQATPFGAGITDGGIARDGTVVKGKGTVTGFVFGIELDSSTRNQILNVTVSDSALDGIFVGDSSLVKGCSADSNGFGDILGGDGIHGKSRVQVEASVVSNNGANGIRVGQGCLGHREHGRRELRGRHQHRGVVHGDQQQGAHQRRRRDRRRRQQEPCQRQSDRRQLRRRHSRGVSEHGDEQPIVGQLRELHLRRHELHIGQQSVTPAPAWCSLVDGAI